MKYVFLWQYKFANHSTFDYIQTGKASLSFQIINQRADFAFALFTGGLENVCEVTISTKLLILYKFFNPCMKLIMFS